MKKIDINRMLILLILMLSIYGLITGKFILLFLWIPFGWSWIRGKHK